MIFQNASIILDLAMKFGFTGHSQTKYKTKIRICHYHYLLCESVD